MNTETVQIERVLRFAAGLVVAGLSMAYGILVFVSHFFYQPSHNLISPAFSFLVAIWMSMSAGYGVMLVLMLGHPQRFLGAISFTFLVAMVVVLRHLPPQAILDAYETRTPLEPVTGFIFRIAYYLIPAVAVIEFLSPPYSDRWYG